MMTLHDFGRGPYPARVRIALAELGLLDSLRLVEVDLRKGAHKRPDFITKNISGTLPVLELEDGTFLAECTAITVYLDALVGDGRLSGTTPQERGVIQMMTRRAEIEFLDPISVYFHHATPGLGPEVEVYQNPDWGNHMRDKALRGARYFDDLLSGQDFVAGEGFSMADIALFGGFVFAGILRLEIPAEFEHLHAWHRRIDARPSVAAWRASLT
jgi:glutathione S-transferase